MKSLTAIYYTANVIREPFGENVRKQILKCIDNMPLISISQKPMNFGENICVGNIGQSHINIYRQMLIGAKAAQTDYVIMCEDDILYTPGHFTSFLPDLDTFAYNLNRWRIYTWSSVFSYTSRVVASQLIAPRLQLIKTLQEKFDKFPNPDRSIWKFFCEPGRREKQLGVTPQKMINFKSKDPSNLVFNHKDSICFAHKGKRKSHGPNRKKKLPYWGTVKDVMKKYYGS